MTATTASPAFTPEHLSKLEQTLGRHISSGAVPGLVALVADRGQTHVLALGAMSVEGGAPVQRDSIFRIASMTKPITAVAAMMLVEEGALKLEAPIEDLAPELADRCVLRRIDGPLDDTVPAQRPITVEDVLTFRLGWGIVFADGWPIVAATAGLPGFGMPDPTCPITPDEYLRRLGALPLMAQPGARWLYTTGSNVLGVLVSRAAGKPLDQVLSERIFQPLGMRDTAFYVPAEKRSRFVTAYRPHGGALVLFDPPQGMYAAPPRFPAGDSGLVSTADDFAAFGRFMWSGLAPDGRRLLSQASLRAMTTNHLTQAQRDDGQIVLGPGRGWGYGLGVRVDDSSYGPKRGAYGWDGGFGTSWLNDPASGRTAILLTQRLFDSPDLPQAHKDFWTAAFAD